ncbi:MAG: DNA internalization-related competence protein ComEC/Rec2 [Candidatus Acidiferrum sp.]|jgi:competence protein ComEC
MKLPAVALAASFSGGILLGLQPVVARHATSRHFLILLLAFLIACLLLAILLARREKLWPGASSSLAAWVTLGIFAACVAQQPLPPEHVLRRMATGQISSKEPLRYVGRLRNEVSRLPWGYGMELDLSRVESAEGVLPLRGGMRVGFAPKDGGPGLPELHAGDEIAVLTTARLPLVYKDAGAFDRRDFLAQQNIHVQATLRASTLLEKIATPAPSLETRLARWRGNLRNELDALFPASPDVAGILRAMLLGDRAFIDRSESLDFQKTGVFHVLVVAGLHVGALAFFLFWLTRRLRLPHTLATLVILLALFAYIAVVEQRPPVLRAGLMTGIVVLGTFYYRRLELLNSAALAALILLLAKPKAVVDTSFQLSFLAIGCIAGIALPWMQTHVQPFVHALKNWRDVTRDAAYAPRQVQYRLDLRDTARLLTARLSTRAAIWTQNTGVTALRGTFRLAELFALSLVLQFGMLPLMAQDFHRITLLGPLANLLAVSLTGLIVPLGFCSLGLALVWSGLGRVAAMPLAWLVHLQGGIVHLFARIPRGSYRIPGPPHWVILLFFAAILALAAGLRFQQARGCFLRWSAVAVAVFAAILIARYPFRPSVVPNALEMTVLDVAQGDSILVISPKGSTLLIDGGGTFQGFQGREEHLGPDPGEDAVSPYLWSRGIQKLDAVALTHAHQDHIGGLTAILQNFKVGQLWLGRETAVPAFARLKDEAALLHVPIEHELRGQHFLWDGVQLDFLWPEIPPEEVAPLAKNNDSLVVRLRYKDRTILLPGDAEKQAEAVMLAENDTAVLHADVLKVGHHGGKNSTMPDFLAAVAPQISIISAGEENPYGHPSPELLQRLQGSGTRLLRTDRDGAVRVLTDGHSLRVDCFVPCPEPVAPSQSAPVPEHREQN